MIPDSFQELLQWLTGNPMFLGLAAALGTGWIIRGLHWWRPQVIVADNAARTLAVVVAFGLALAAYSTQALQGTVRFSVEGVYQLVLLTALVGGGSQISYTGYKLVKGAVNARPPTD